MKPLCLTLNLLEEAMGKEVRLHKSRMNDYILITTLNLNFKLSDGCSVRWSDSTLNMLSCKFQVYTGNLQH